MQSSLKLDKQKLSQVLEQSFDDKLTDKPANAALRGFLKKLKIMAAPRKLSVAWLARSLKSAPRPHESGVLYGIRHNTIGFSPLSNAAFQRLVFPKRYTGEEGLVAPRIEKKAALYRVPLRRHKHDNQYFKNFTKLFRQSLDDHPVNPHEGVLHCWNNLINTVKITKLNELVKRSKELPELILLVLNWLFHASQRAGKSRPRVATSTIKTYFSRIVRILCDEVGNRSLVSLDYDDLLQHYQNVVDAGDEIDSRGERARNLLDFHEINHKFFGLCDIDFHDLDVEVPDKFFESNIITPDEYNNALELLLRDDSTLYKDKYINAAMLILCYRLGLRRMECGRILFSDWNHHDGLLHIHSNRFGRTKSVAGNRRIPFHLFMNDMEMEILNFVLGSHSNECKRSNSPIFGDVQHPEQLRRLEPHFARVIEALKVSTGDEKARLHDCRHSFITFVSSGLVLSDKPQDSIAKTVRSWFKQESLDDFVKAYVASTIKIPTTRAAYLPALSLMVGHSSAKVTIKNYLHLMDYWRWLAIEEDFRRKKTLDDAVVNWSGIDKQYLISRKNVFKQSSAYTVLPTLIERIDNIPSFDGENFPLRSQVDFQLSQREVDSVPEQLSRLQEVDEILRHLEYVDSMKLKSEEDCTVDDDYDTDNDHTTSYQLKRNDLTQYQVDKVNAIYQKVLKEVVTHRSYGVVSQDEYVVFPQAMDQAAAAKYLRQEEFYELAEALLRLKKSHPDEYLVLLNDWAGSWDSGKRTVYLLGSKCPNWQCILEKMGVSISFGDEKVLKHNQLSLCGKKLESITLPSDTKMKVRVFGHLVFLLTMLDQSENLNSKCNTLSFNSR